MMTIGEGEITSDPLQYVRSSYENGVTDAVVEFFEEMKGKALAFGINESSLCYDCGIGFGKTREDDIELLKNCRSLSEYSPLLIGVSRKRVIGELTGALNPKDRVAGSVSAAVCCAKSGAGVLRVHDVKETADALIVADILL